MDTNKADEVISGLQKNFKVVGSSRIHSWYAWAATGVALGVLVAVAYVANRSGQFDQSNASGGTFACPLLKSPFDFSGTGVGFMLLPGNYGPGGDQMLASSEDNYNFYYNTDGTPKAQPVYDIRTGELLGTKPSSDAVSWHASAKAKALENCQKNLASSQAAAQKQCDDQRPPCVTAPNCVYSTNAGSAICAEASCGMGTIGQDGTSYSYDRSDFTEDNTGLLCVSKSNVARVSCSCTGVASGIPVPGVQSGPNITGGINDDPSTPDVEDPDEPTTPLPGDKYGPNPEYP
jgi:hypothetical protein